jgi:hypothetical protein
MTHGLDDVRLVADDELLSRLERLVKADRAIGVKLLVHLAEVEARKLYLERGYSSMYGYCMEALGMSEAETYLRLLAAKTGKRFPLVLARLADGGLHLTAIKLLEPLLTDENHVALLDRARGMSKRQILVLIAELAPKPDVPERVRKLPASRASAAVAACPPGSTAVETSDAPAPSGSPVVASQASTVAAASPFALQPPPARASTSPLSPGRFKLELTLGQEAHDQLEQLRELLRHQNPSGEIAHIVERALRELLERTLKRRFAQSGSCKRKSVRATEARDADAEVVREARDSDAEVVREARDADAEVLREARSAASSRYVPRPVLREVYARDAGQCTYVSASGRRCAARGFLEVHHHLAFARGGEASVDNLQLTCRAHNFLLAERDFGPEFMQRKLVQARSSVSSAVRNGP